jgi:predicted secreted hydrolase
MRHRGFAALAFSVSIVALLGGLAFADEGYRRAVEPRPFVFPEDHGPHDAYQLEWWYFTGNVETAEGRRFGYQLTFFRQALTPTPRARSSAWGTSQLYFAHLAIGDEGTGRFEARERFSREAVGLAGAQADPFRVWLETWEAVAVEDDTAFPMRLRALDDGFGLDLFVDPLKPIALQGDRGLSQKGPEPGNASYYYSATRLSTEGRIVIDGEVFEVSGSSWLDREWSTSALDEAHLGWDWFAIQLEDGRDIMLGRLRREDGAVDPYNAGLVVGPGGTTQRLGAEDVRYEELSWWTSSRSDARYPVSWRIEIEPLGLTLTTTPMIEASELDVSVQYWEGAIDVVAVDEDGRRVEGRGFLEMTGYHEGSQGLLR